jgi:hypothetical protein
MPQQNENAGFKWHTEKRGCRVCLVRDGEACPNLAEQDLAQDPNNHTLSLALFVDVKLLLTSFVNTDCASV